MEELENGVTESVADSEPNLEETAVEETTQQVEEPAAEEPAKEPEIPDSVWAIARKRSEREAQARIDRQIAQRFGQYKNPATGKNIATLDDYFAAMDAQAEQSRQEAIDRMTANQSREQQEALRQILANDPEKRRLNARVQELEQKQVNEQAETAFNRDFAELQKLEPALKTVNDLEKLNGFDKIVQLVQEKGLDMVTAYKAVNFGRATQASQAAGKQAAINAAKGKNHLAAHDGQAQPGTQKVMSESMLNLAKEAFPDKSDAEIQKLYNSI
jgi:hypothetical protein|nr:MAG TPA: hypothetical protein [Ackermannviridae sp.]